MRSHSFTCHLADMIFPVPPLPQSIKARTQFGYFGGMQGWVDLVGWLHTLVVYLPENGHPFQYYLARCWVTLLMWRTMLPLCQLPTILRALHWVLLFTVISHGGAVIVIYWWYVTLVVVLWHPALSSSALASVTTLRWEPVNVRLVFGVTPSRNAQKEFLIGQSSSSHATYCWMLTISEWLLVLMINLWPWIWWQVTDTELDETMMVLVIVCSAWFRVCEFLWDCLTAARNHVNRMCLAADVPLIESGTAGYLGQVTVVKKVTLHYYCF